MGKYSYETYAEAMNKSATETKQEKKDYPRIGFFKLNADKPSAIVRFDVASANDLTIIDVHNIKTDKGFRNVACLRNNDETWDKCPLCASNIKSRRTQVFIRLLEYSVNEEGKVVANPVVWQRAATFAPEMISNINDYGDLRECLFKVTWSKVDNKTEFTVKFQPDKGIYTEQAGYVKDFSAFKNFLVNKHSYMERTFEELTEFVKTGVMPSRYKKDAKTEVKEDVKAEVPAEVEHPADEDMSVAPNMGHIESSKEETVVTQRAPMHVDEDGVIEEEPTMRRRRYSDIAGDLNTPF